MWLESTSGGVTTWVTELSQLEHSNQAANGVVTLPGGGRFDLRNATPDTDGEDIYGWNFDHNGRKYLVIND
jgi:hypothetical protein